MFRRSKKKKKKKKISIKTKVDRFRTTRTETSCSITTTKKNNICSVKENNPEKQPRKYQTNRSSSLPARSSNLPNLNIDNQRHSHRQAYWNLSFDEKIFLSNLNIFDEDLLSRLKRSMDFDFDKKLKMKTRSNSTKSNDAFLSSSNSTTNSNDKYATVDMSTDSTNLRPSFSFSSFQSLKTSIFDITENDHDDVLTSINFLLERVESLVDEQNKKENLIDYLKFLFGKFLDDDFDPNSTMIDDCPTLIQSGCLNNSILSEGDDRTEKSFVTPNSVDDSWLLVDFPEKTNSDQNNCLLPSSSSLADDPCLLPNESYFSFEEIKSCASESSQSNYYSPNSSLVDLQTMLPEFDEISNTNSNNNNNNNIFCNDDGTATIDLNNHRTTEQQQQQQQQQEEQLNQGQQTSNNVNVIIETINPNKLSSRLVNGKSSDSETVESSTSMKSDLTETNKLTNQERKSRREKKIQERWTVNVKNDQQNGSNNESSSNKAFLGVEFPPIAVLRRKFSSMPSSSTNSNGSTLKRKDQSNSTSNKSSTIATKNVLTTDKTKDTTLPEDQNQETSSQDQLDLTGLKEKLQSTFHDVSSSINNVNDVQEISRTSSEHEKTVDDQEIKKNELSTSVDEDPIENFLVEPVSTSIDDDCRCSSTNQCFAEQSKEHSDENIINTEKKNNCNDELRTNATGIVLTHVESIDVVDINQQEKEEEQKLLLLLLQQQKKRRDNIEQTSMEKQTPDDLLFPENSDIHQHNRTMIEPDVNQTCYTKIELEELPDDEEILIEQNGKNIEPTDFILIDDEQKLSSMNVEKPVEINDDHRVPSNVVVINKPPIPSSTNQRPEDDPIALRALQRFEQRMNAAVTSRPPSADGKLSTSKGKSSWSGSMTTPRKSLENLFKNKSYSNETDEILSSSQNESFIRPRRTFLDDNNLNSFVNPSSLNKIDSNNDQTKDQQIPKDIIDENNNKPPDENCVIMSETVDDTNRTEINPNNTETSITNENGHENNVEILSSTHLTPSNDSSLNADISVPIISNDPTNLTHYRFQIEGRRRLNTIDKIRERHQSVDSSMNLQQNNSSLQNQYAVKNEDVQDPIIRRALERFDEQNRVLQQTKPSNYDDIQDPITRRALMRLETNLKRTMPNNSKNYHEPNPDNWYNTNNNYSMSSSQINPDPNFNRMSDASLPPPIPNHRSYFSTHQRYPTTTTTTTNDFMNEFSNGHPMPIDDPRSSAFRYPVQPTYMMSNHPAQTSINFRQRSRSEDPLSSKDLSIGLNNNFTDMSTEEIQHQQPTEEISQKMETDATVPNENLIDSNHDNNTSRSVVVTQANSISEQNQSNQEFVNEPIPIQTDNGFSADYRYTQTNSNDIHSRNSSAFLPVHPPQTATYYSQQILPTNSYTQMYASTNLQQTPYSDDPIVRRALERFNCQMQQSLMNTSQHQGLTGPSSNGHHGSRSFVNGNHRLNSIESFYPNEFNGHDVWTNSYHSMPRASHLNGNNMGHSSTTTGYQSIIGRRRQMRQDDAYFDGTAVGNGYSSSLFINGSNLPNHHAQSYMTMVDEPPRFNREHFVEQTDYMCENINNNNNTTNPIHHQNYIHHPGNAVYPTATSGFRPINQIYPSTDMYHQFQDEDYLRHRAQSTSSTGSSDSVNPIRLIHQRLPNNVPRANNVNNTTFSPDQCQMTTSPPTSSFSNGSGDSVFQRLAYTGTKSSLSKSSSNLCSNLPNKGSINANPLNNLKTHEIDLDETNNQSTIENHQETIGSPTNVLNKSLRSRSVDARARLKSAQTRLINGGSRPSNDYDEHQTTANVPSSKFTSVTARRETQPVPPRPPITPRSNNNERASATTRRGPNSHTLNFNRTSSMSRTRASNGNLLDGENSLSHELENEEHSTVNNDQYHQPKIVENKTRLAMAINRTQTNGSHLQSSASTSSVGSALSRSKLTSTMSSQFESRDMNPSNGDLTRNYKRSDDHRLVSPGMQRRPIPVSVFSPAKIETKRQAPAPPKSISPIDDSVRTSIDESTRTSMDETNKFSSTSSSSEITTTIDEQTNNGKLSQIPSVLKSSTGNLLKDISLHTDRTDPNSASKKMNVFERLFRGHKKKI